MITKNFWELLEEKQNSLTKSGLIIADYLTKHAEDAQFLSISSPAKECSMAEATIYRFCKQLGFEGYNEMKIALAQANASPADVVLLCGALEPPLDGGSIPVKVGELFVAESLIMRYLLDNKELATIARDKTSTAMVVKLL